MASAIAAPQYQREQQYSEKRAQQYQPEPYVALKDAPQVTAEQWDRLNPIKSGESYELDQLRKEWDRFLA